ncbi:helix-turn-helix domain-containing protein [Campylobacter coli]|nr:helix-turn-helix domain-containing protein [Campylobacter coli]EJC1927514.1 helix-turn-helix domain-containing protein [Campylobacter coli]EKR5865789.1 helix-turn-helix domain-containing protein [Campylobacter coli]ELE3370013.1 helix-turn-helix domain-containing protein [Campylobacter coli]ELZ2728464.1 helix-turn-helix domain-containing protein [Campylobacter coli]
MTEEKENIVKKVCKELNITQKELSEILGVPQTTISGWATTKIPKMVELALNLLIENKTLREKLEIFKKAHKIASEL